MSSLSLSALFSVQDKVALVTGGGTGIGLCIAQGLVENGAKVYITGRREKVIQDAAAKLNASGPGKAVAIVADSSSKDSIQNLVRTIEASESHLDLLVNNAGIARAGTPSSHLDSIDKIQSAMWSSSPEEWKDQFLINSAGPYFVTVAFLHLLAKAAEKGDGSGSVVNITSIVSRIHSPFTAKFGYNASKAAAEQITRLLAAKVQKTHIRVNSVAPGYFPSEMNDPSNPHAPSNPENAKRNVPYGRAGTPEDIAGTIIYLASRAGAYVNGQFLDVDGGVMLIVNGNTNVLS